ncbi:MAG: membrane protein insertion efficiency factor YidD [Blastochloris viridis]|uniref:Putative membrane protein insertion efficiency factor n=1 Tax=Blastochloris viridis TaxID=1079 RepID=A0A6N4QXR9_BLAVI|nr:MAG: membrane protein insertion efficiency factor YidD [Blastochloris viridis]
MLNHFARKAVWGLIRVYQLTLSAFIGRRCRFEPSCSHYAQEAVMVHGVWKGGVLAAKRVARCGPLGGHGYDPVPPLKSKPEQSGGCACCRNDGSAS